MVTSIVFVHCSGIIPSLQSCLLSLCISAIILSPQPEPFHLLSHLFLGFCFSLIDLPVFPLPQIGHRLLPLYLLHSVCVQSSLVHPPALCCFRCRCSTGSIASWFPPFQFFFCALCCWCINLYHRNVKRCPQCSNCQGVEPPYLTLPTPLPLVEFQPPHLSFAKVGMLLDSHFLLMQFLNYLQRDDLNVTTILIHISGVAKGVWGLNPHWLFGFFLILIVKKK